MYSTAPIYPALEELVLTEWMKRLTEKLGADHAMVKKILGGRTPEEAARDYVRGSKLADVAELEEADGGPGGGGGKQRHDD